MKRLFQISLLLGVAPMMFADQNDQKGSKDLPSSFSSSWVDVMIQFNTNTSSKALQDQLDFIQNLVKQSGQNDQQGQQQGQHGAKVFRVINALHLKIPA